MHPALKIAALAGVALAGAWGVGRVGAQEEAKAARSARGGAPTVPRYTYGPGYYGYGYYEYTSPAPRSRPTGPHSYATTPGMFGPGGMTVGPYHRDWTAGRSSPLAKPWLRPMD
jgi:hypothetical protein